MYGREKRVLLREYLEQGWTKEALARKAGINRRTIYRWVESGQLDRNLDNTSVTYANRPRVPRLIDPYVGIIHERLGNYPELSAVRLHAEITAAGYSGCYTQVKEYVRKIRQRPPVEPVVRFETPPGHQAQVDFAQFRLPWGKRWILLVTLGYSRLLWGRYYPRQTMANLMNGIEDAFCFFGGVPREMLFDQLKAVIIADRRPEGEKVIENITFLRFAHHWGFRIRACRPYRAQTKGKVERTVDYVRKSFFYGRPFVSDDHLNQEFRRWLDDVANVRIHGTTKEVPQERFERQERAALGPLASRRSDSPEIMRRASRKRVRQATPILPTVEVEQRPLAAYSTLVGGIT